MAEGIYKYGYGIVVLLAITLLVIAMMTMMETDDATNSVDTNSPSVDVGQGIEPNNPPVAVETETANSDTEPTVSETSGLKLLKEVGPIELPLYTEGMPVVQTEEINTEGFRVIATVSSRRDTSVSIVETNPERRIVVLLLLKDKQGNTIESLSREDTETRNLYFLRESRGKGGVFDGNTIATPNYAVCPSERKADKLKNVYSWEVLVYIE